MYLNFTNIEVELEGNKVVKTCPAAVGAGFAAGTTDGPGVFGFQQGDTQVNPWSLVIFDFASSFPLFIRIELMIIWKYIF